MTSVRRFATLAAALLAAGLTAPAAASADCAGADAAPAEQGAGAAGAAAVCLVNQERTARGLRSVRLQTQLTRAAQGYAEVLVAGGFFAHVTPEGVGLVDRVMAAGYLGPAAGPWTVGENLAWGQGTRATPRGIVAAWMASPSHRANVLDVRYEEIGVGVTAGTPTAGPEGATYATDFGHRTRPRAARAATPARGAAARRPARSAKRRPAGRAARARRPARAHPERPGRSAERAQSALYPRPMLDGGQRHGRRAGLMTGLATALLLAAAAAPAHAAAGPPALPPGMTRLSDEVRLTRWAHPFARGTIFSRPTSQARRTGRLRLLTEDGFPEVYLALAQWRDDTGRTWVRIRVPGRPNGRTGWVAGDALGPLTRVTTRLVVDRRRLRATLFRDGRAVFRARVGIGTPATPTPAGRFWIREKFRVGGASLYGPRAIGTSAYAPTLSDWPGGGVVGLHGTDQPGLIPGRPSHGCVRLRNADIVRLYRLAPIGTPVRIR